MTDLQCWCGGKASNWATEDGTYMCQDSLIHDPLATGRRDVVRKLYIAGPMTGYPQANYPAFNDAAEALRTRYNVVNPADVEARMSLDGRRLHYVDLLREDLKVMLECDGVAILEGWWESAGARNEISVAGILKMPVRTVSDWLDR